MVFILASQTVYYLAAKDQKSKKAVVWEKDWQRKSKIRAATLYALYAKYSHHTDTHTHTTAMG